MSGPSITEAKPQNLLDVCLAFVQMLLSQLEEKQQQHDKLEAECVEYLKEIEMLRSERDNLDATLEETSHMRDEFDARANALEDERDDLFEQVRKLKAKLAAKKKHWCYE